MSYRWQNRGSGCDRHIQTPWRPAQVRLQRVRGVAPECRLISLKVLNERGEMTAIVSIIHDLTKVVENERLASELGLLNEEIDLFESILKGENRTVVEMARPPYFVSETKKVSELLRECLQLQLDDEAGQTWSEKNYPGGYTSYHSAHRMQQMSPTFEQLERHLRRHVKAFVKTLELDMTGRELAMTDCWVNIMPQHVVHGLHLHPLSTISGTYYVQTPKNSPGLKFEDPRLDRFMAAPPRKANSASWVVLPAEAGNVVLFESWLRHEVPPNQTKQRRISISFNFNWS